jgi:hypothetical protein
MATTDDLLLLDRAVSNYRKAELFPAAHARQLKGLGSYGEDLSRLVRRSQEAAFALRAAARRRREGLNESRSPVRSAGK